MLRVVLLASVVGVAAEARAQADETTTCSEREIADGLRRAMDAPSPTPVDTRVAGSPPVRRTRSGRYVLDFELAQGDGPPALVHVEGATCADAIAAMYRQLWDCPSVADFEAAISQRLAGVLSRRRAVLRSPVSVDLQLDRTTDGSYVAVLDVESEDGSRRDRVEGHACREVMERALDRIEQPPPRWTVSFLVLGLADVGSTLALTAGGRVGIALRYDALSLVLALDELLPQSGAVAGTRGVLSAFPLSGALLGCGRAIDGGVALDVCGGALAGAHLMTYEDMDTHKDAGFMLALEGSVMLGIPILQRFSLVFTADLIVPLIRPALVVPELPNVVAASEVVAGRFGLGLFLTL